MARLVNAAESWETVYSAFATVNFSAFDYNTVKQSLLAYLQLYFPEDYNDYIESSEFIAILELFSYTAELMAYRLDLNAHENFMSTASRKESVLRLANFISYTPTRNLPARGLVKMTSVTTSQNVYDSLGNNLANVKIVWNDTSNPNWREQFLLVMDNVLTQPFGTVLPSNRVQVGDVLLELYTLNNSPLSSTGGGQVFSYSSIVQGQGYPMELVPVSLTSNGPEERRPENNTLFTLMYGNDGLGDGSTTTGFLMFTKQGTLSSTTTTFDGVTPNQTFDVNVNNINDTDVWLNNINPNTGDVITINPLPSSITTLSPGYQTTYGYWYPVDTTGAQNVIFNTDSNRHKYQIESNNNDQITLIFGDGEMADIPQGSFQIWYRTSANQNIVVPATSVSNQVAAFNYVDITGSTQTLTFTFSLTNSLLNASITEDIDHIRDTSPGVYYTQDRMVNAQDYNTYMLQDPSILKLSAFNRTFAGDSKYIAWHDPSGSYENVKLFGDDLALYFANMTPPNGRLTIVSTNIAAETLLLNYIQPLLASADFFTTLAPVFSSLGLNPATMRTTFTSSEQTSILAALNNPSYQNIYFYYSVLHDAWVVNTSGPPYNPSDDSYIYMMLVTKTFTGSNQTGWTINYISTELVAQSASTHFWNTNNGVATINYDTLNSNQDTVVVLSANINAQQGILGENLNFNVLSQVIDPLTPGLPNLTMLNVLPTDANGDGIPDDMALTPLLNYDYTETITGSTPVNAGRYTITLPETYLAGYGSQDLVVQVQPHEPGALPIVITQTAAGPGQIYYNDYPPISDPNAVVINQIQIGGTMPTVARAFGVGDIVTVTLNDYVYLSRLTVSDPYTPVLTSDSVKTQWAADATTEPQLQTYIRFPGRYPFNFGWFHQAQDFHLIDPAASNIIDMYIITVGYYQALREWLDGQTDVKPTPPTSLDLRTSYATLLQAAMISDTVVLHSGDFTLLFGSSADPTLQATFAVVRPPTNVTMTDNQVQNAIVSIIQDFFDPNYWQFGETFFFTELAAVVQQQLASEIDSIVIVPAFSTNQFGDLFEISPGENQLFLPDISTSQINIVAALTPQVLRQAGY